MGEWAGHGGLFFKKMGTAPKGWDSERSEENEEHWRKRMQKVIVKAGGGAPQPVPSREAFGTHTVAFRPPYISTGANQAAPSFRS